MSTTATTHADTHDHVAPADAVKGSATDPLFYGRPQLLDSQVHAHWRVVQGDAAFAAGTNAVPLMASEFVEAARHYPVVFAGVDHVPVAVLGMGGGNRYITDGIWTPGTYVPAYVRRYPFVFAEVQGGFALAVDADAPMLRAEGEEGAPLFENGQPSDITRNALQFCDAFTRESAVTRELSVALGESGLLVDRVATITPATGNASTLNGFAVIDADAFAALPDAVVVEWHRKGWLRLIHAHLGSLARFPDLLEK